MTEVVHQVGGRVCVRVPVVKQNPAYTSTLEDTVRKTRGVRSVAASPLTGTILVHYDAALTNANALTATIPRSAQKKAALTLASRVGSESKMMGSRIAGALARYLIEAAVERAAIGLIAAVL